LIAIVVADLILLIILTALVSGNNLSAAVGALVGSRTLSRIGGALIGIAGYIAGFLTEGYRMTSAASSLLPHSYYYTLLLFSVAVFIFLIAELLRSPLSLTMVLVGVSVGISLRHGFDLNLRFLYLLIATWILIPFASIAISYISNRGISRVRASNPWSMALFFKLSLIVVAIFTAFTLGANTIGLIGAFYGISNLEKLCVVSGIVAGSFLLSSGVLKRVGEEMYSIRYSNAMVSTLLSSLMVEISTFFSIPMSNTQTLTSCVFGSGLSYKMRAIYFRPFLLVIITWIISPITGLAMGYIF